MASKASAKAYWRRALTLCCSGDGAGSYCKRSFTVGLPHLGRAFPPQEGKIPFATTLKGRHPQPQEEILSQPNFGCTELEDLAHVKLENEKFLRVPLTLALAWEYGERYEPLILKRKCYDGLTASIMDNCKDRGQATVVTGTPGIGKTGFLLYFLWSLLQKQSDWQAIILKFNSMSWFYTFQKKDDRSLVVDRVHNRSPLPIVETVSDGPGPVWYLGDKCIQQEHWGLPCRFVLTCSPNKENYFQFVKGVDRKIIYAPRWSEGELFELNGRVFKHKQDDVSKRFSNWGGVPRYVLSNTHESAQKLLETGIRSFRSYMLETGSIVLPEDVSGLVDAKACHRIIHYEVKNTDYERDKAAFQNAELEFASTYVKDELTRTLSVEVLDKVLNKLKDPSTVKLQAALFDKLLDQFFSSGCQVHWKELNDKGLWGATHIEEMKPVQHKRKLPRGGPKNQDAVLPESGTPEEFIDTILKPESDDNGTWDLIRGKNIYQATVGEKKLKWNKHFQAAYDFLEKVYGQPPEDPSEWFEYVYVVPSSSFESFKLTFPGGKSNQGKRDAVQIFAEKRVKVKKMCCVPKGSHLGCKVAASVVSLQEG